MKKLVIALSGLVLLLLAAILVGPHFIDWNSQKARIAEQVTAWTGRDLTIDGDVSFAILPSPVFSATRLSMANIPGGSAPDMVKLEALEVNVALLPLLQGHLQVKRISLVEPEILLEVLPDGRRNWDFPVIARQAPWVQTGPGVTEPAGPGPFGRVRLDSFTVRGGTVIYRDVRREERLGEVNAEIGAESLAGPFALSGNALARGARWDFSFSLGRLVENGASAVSLRLTLPGSDSELQFSGGLSNHPDGLSLRGSVTVSGSNFAAMMGELGARPTALPGVLSRPFGLQAELTADEQSALAEQVNLRLADLAFGGTVELGFAAPWDLRVALQARRMDLDGLLSKGDAQSPEVVRDADVEAAIGDETARLLRTDLTFLQSMRASLEILVDTLVYRGRVVRQLSLAGQLEDGALTLEQARALLPGGSDFALTGRFSDLAGKLAYVGGLEAASDNLRGLLAWLGIDTDAVPSDRLRKMSVTAELSGTAKEVTARKLDLRIDVSRLTGGVTMAPRTRPGLGIGLKLDAINLDAYLPTRSMAPPGQESRPDIAASGGESAAALAPAFVQFLHAFDANMKLSVGRLTYLGREAQDLSLDATLRNGDLEIRSASFGNLGGATGRYSGSLADLGQELQLDGTFDLAAPELDRLAKYLGHEAKDLRRLGALSLSGTLKGSAAALDLQGHFEALGGRLEVSGAAQPANATFELSVQAAHPSLPGLLESIGTALRPNAEPGAVDLTARVSGSPLDIRIEQLVGTLGEVEIAGALAIDLGGERPEVVIDLVTGALPMTWLLAPAQAGGDRWLSDPAGRRWSPAPLDLSALRRVNGALRLSALAIPIGDIRLDEARLEALLDEGVVTLQQLSGNLYEGRLMSSGSLDLRAGLEADIELTVDDLSLERLLEGFSGSERLSGPLNVNARLTSRGRSEVELLSNLSGAGDLRGTLQVAPGTRAQLETALLGTFGGKIREVRGLADATTTLFDAFVGPPVSLSGSFTIETGVLRTEDMSFAGPQARASTEASLDLPGWRLESRSRVFQAEDPETPYLTVTLRGPADRPNVEIAGKPLARDSEMQPDNAGHGGPPTPDSPPEQAPDPQ